jgi:hypothetical protein
VEERSIADQELDKGTITFNSPSEGITLSPSTWGAWEDLPMDYWLNLNVAVPD